MNGSLVIGIAGKIGAGKDAIAEHLASKYDFKIVRFADALKEEILNTMRLTCEEIWSVYSRKPPTCATESDLREMLWQIKPPIIRRMLQEWGTELRRTENPSYWIEKWHDKINELNHAGRSVVSPDMRFENERTAVMITRGLTAIVTRPGTKSGDHTSETGTADYDPEMFDVHFTNNGTLDDLCHSVDMWMKMFVERS